MEMTTEELKTYATIAKPFIEPIINTILKPQLEKLSSWLKKKNIENKVFDNYFDDKFSKYLLETYKNCSIINTLVFPNQKIKIKDIYEPLTIVKNSVESKKYTISDTFNNEFFKDEKKMLISDYAGMGKSTLMKWITLTMIENNFSIPILIELQKLDKSNKIIDELFNQIDPIDKSFDKELIFKLLELGSFTIIFDGFDEIPEEFATLITTDLKNFIKKLPENNFIITSRPEPSLSSFGDFQHYTIEPLKNKQAIQLIKKYDRLNSINYSDSLIAEIEGASLQVEDFLGNPLMVSLLYKSYTFNKDIPSKKSTFYEEVFSALFKHHDLSKDCYKRDKHSKLDIYDFRLVLRFIAFETSRIGKTTYLDLEILEIIKKTGKKAVKTDFNASDFLEDLLSTVPLFIREGTKVKWAHKSIQDYFTAEYIVYSSMKEEILEKILLLKKEKYYNVLDLIYELDYTIFWKKILIPVLEKFIDHYENFELKYENIPLRKLNDRKSLTFLYSYCLIRDSSGFEARQKYLAKLNIVDNSKELYVIGFGGTEIILISNIEFENKLLEISLVKGDDLFKALTYGSGFLEKLRISETSLLPLPKSAYIVSSKVDDINFTKENFYLTNEILKHSRPIGNPLNRFMLSYEKVVKFLEKAKKEIEAKNIDNDLENL